MNIHGFESFHDELFTLIEKENVSAFLYHGLRKDAMADVKVVIAPQVINAKRKIVDATLVFGPENTLLYGNRHVHYERRDWQEVFPEGLYVQLDETPENKDGFTLEEIYTQCAKAAGLNNLLKEGYTLDDLFVKSAGDDHKFPVPNDWMAMTFEFQPTNPEWVGEMKVVLTRRFLKLDELITNRDLGGLHYPYNESTPNPESDTKSAINLLTHGYIHYYGKGYGVAKQYLVNAVDKPVMGSGAPVLELYQGLAAYLYPTIEINEDFLYTANVVSVEDIDATHALLKLNINDNQLTANNVYGNTNPDEADITIVITAEEKPVDEN